MLVQPSYDTSGGQKENGENSSRPQPDAAALGQTPPSALLSIPTGAGSVAGMRCAGATDHCLVSFHYQTSGFGHCGRYRIIAGCIRLKTSARGVTVRSREVVILHERRKISRANKRASTGHLF
ncbi:hypothetical protein ABZX75_34340, partial [Streptomyces sp. NPDC003038]|uniref:hypothetical protein n=1 Tax=unclassified Streptomyces TaxID=2593676 RepID=UPI0033AA7445